MPVDFETLQPLLEIALDREAPELTLDSHLYTDAGMDSMGAVALVVEIERQFGVRLDEEIIPELYTPRQYIAAIEQAAAPKPSEDTSVGTHATD